MSNRRNLNRILLITGILLVIILASAVSAFAGDHFTILSDGYDYECILFYERNEVSTDSAIAGAIGPTIIKDDDFEKIEDAYDNAVKIASGSSLSITMHITLKENAEVSFLFDKLRDCDTVNVYLEGHTLEPADKGYPIFKLCCGTLNVGAYYASSATGTAVLKSYGMGSGVTTIGGISPQNYGGCLDIYGGTAHFSKVNFTTVNEENCVKGGAIMLWAGKVECDNCDFEGCQAKEGGAIYVKRGGLSLDYCTFEHCTASTHGSIVTTEDEGWVWIDHSKITNDLPNSNLMYFGGDFNVSIVRTEIIGSVFAGHPLIYMAGGSNLSILTDTKIHDSKETVLRLEGSGSTVINNSSIYNCYPKEGLIEVNNGSLTIGEESIIRNCGLTGTSAKSLIKIGTGGHFIMQNEGAISSCNVTNGSIILNKGSFEIKDDAYINYCQNSAGTNARIIDNMGVCTCGGYSMIDNCGCDTMDYLLENSGTFTIEGYAFLGLSAKKALVCNLGYGKFTACGSSVMYMQGSNCLIENCSSNGEVNITGSSRITTVRVRDYLIDNAGKLNLDTKGDFVNFSFYDSGERIVFYNHGEDSQMTINPGMPSSSYTNIRVSGGVPNVDAFGRINILPQGNKIIFSTGGRVILGSGFYEAEGTLSPALVFKSTQLVVSDAAIKLKGYSKKYSSFISLNDSSTLSMRGNSTIDLGNNDFSASAFSVDTSSSILMYDSSCIKNCKNSSGNGGAVNGAGIVEMNDNASISSCSAKNGGAFGGALIVSMYDASSVNNSSATESGGVFAVSGSVDLRDGASFNTISASTGGLFAQVPSSLKMENGVTATNVSCKKGGLFYFDKDTSLSDMTLAGGMADDGGAIYCSGNLSLSNVTITGAKANVNGGGVYAKKLTLSNASEITKCSAIKGGGVYAESLVMGKDDLIQQCSAQNGGGVYLTKSLEMSSSAKIYDCKAERTYDASSEANGGAVYFEGNSLLMKGSSILKACSAKDNGGAVYFKGIAGSKSNIAELRESAKLLSCTAGSKGGGVYVSEECFFSMYSKSNIEYCNAVYGGGIYTAGTVKINCENSNSLISVRECGQSEGDLITLKGGGIYVAGGAEAKVSGSTYIAVCNAVDGGGVYVESSGTFSMSDTVQINSNNCRNNGAGLYVLGEFNFAGGQIVYCTADGKGGAFYTEGSSAVVKMSGDTMIGNCSSGTAKLTANAFHAAGGQVIINSGSVRNRFTVSGSARIIISGGWFTEKVNAQYIDGDLQASDRFDGSPYRDAPYTVLKIGNSVTITFVKNIGTDADKVITVAAVKNQLASLLSEGFTETSYVLNGWRTQKDGGKFYEKGVIISPIDNLTFYGDWSVAEGAERTLTYKDTSGYNDDVVKTSVKSTITVDAPKFTRVSYKIAGWSESEDGSTGFVSNGSDISFENGLSKTLYVIWKSTTLIESGDYKILYKDPTKNNGDYTFYSKSNLVTVIDTLFAREAYDFDCWNTKADGTGTKYYIGSMLQIAQSNGTVNLYAQWKNKSVASAASKISQDYEPVDQEKDEKPEGREDEAGTVSYYDPKGGNDVLTMSPVSDQAQVINMPYANKRSGYKIAYYAQTAQGNGKKYYVGDILDFEKQLHYDLFVVWELDQTSQQTTDDNKVKDEQEQKFGKSNNDEEKKVYSDVAEGQWYTEYIEWAVENEIIGDEDVKEFSPDLPCTRAQFVQFLWKTMGSPVADKKSGMPFTDVSKSYKYYDAILWCYQNDIIHGVSPAEFAPEEALSRAEATTIFYNYNKGTKPANRTNRFSDVADDAWYAAPIEWGYQNSILNGVTLTRFMPDDYVTRAEAISLINRCADNKIIADDRNFV